jgi:predicted Zn-dependent protease
MRTLLFSCVAAAALAGAITGAGAMGGGSGGGYSGNMTVGGDSGGPSEYSIAVRLIKHDKCGDALPHLNSALEKKPNNADVLNYLGYCQRKIGNYQYSLDYYNRALAIEPDHKGVHEYLGELYLAMNKPDDANKELATLATLCPRGCDEKDVLTKAISDYQAAQPAAAAPASTAPSQQQ